MQTKRTSAAGVINPARGALAIISLAVLGGIAVTPAYAFTDINGRVCATSQLIANPTDPNGPSVCPAGSVGFAMSCDVAQTRPLMSVKA